MKKEEAEEEEKEEEKEEEEKVEEEEVVEEVEEEESSADTKCQLTGIQHHFAHQTPSHLHRPNASRTYAWCSGQEGTSAECRAA